jgi:antitoxin (DNA-binding transcriptional repressor) of toxin-antitoxin stability system
LYKRRKSGVKNVISISEARKELPRMIREIQKKPGTVFKITVRNETIAEVRSANRMVPAGEAVRKLANLRKKLFSSAKEGDQEPVSKRVKDYLYPEGNS